MKTFFIDYLNNIQELHEEIRNIVNELPQSALDWTISSDTNSLNVLVVHLIGAERYWIGDVVAGEPSMRDRASEFKVKKLTGDELIKRLGETENYIQVVLEKLTYQELHEKRISPRDGREVTVGWALCHALKHTALHLGHIQLTHQLWERHQSL